MNKTNKITKYFMKNAICTTEKLTNSAVLQKNSKNFSKHIDFFGKM